jgi:hypothetical protein
LKRAIYVGRVASYQAKQHEEMQAVADALSLLANLVMAGNTTKMQPVLDRWNARRSTAVPPELIGRIAPTRTEGINLRGVFTFPIEQYQAQLLPSLPATKSRAFWRLNGSSERRQRLLSQRTERPLYSAGYRCARHFRPRFRRQSSTFGMEIKGTPLRTPEALRQLEHWGQRKGEGEGIPVPRRGLVTNAHFCV